MNFGILLALAVQFLISKMSNLAGAIFGVVVTTGILIWGITVYASGGTMMFMRQRQSETEFVVICLFWLFGSVGQAYLALKAAQRSVGLGQPPISPLPADPARFPVTGMVNGQPASHSYPATPAGLDGNDSGLPRE